MNRVRRSAVSWRHSCKAIASRGGGPRAASGAGGYGMVKRRMPAHRALAVASLGLALASGLAPAHAQTAPAATSPATATPAPATPAPATSAPAAEPAASGTPATVVDDDQIGSTLGKKVKSPAGEDMGRIVDVLVDRSGAVRAAVVDFGGFFGVGTRKIAVDWHALHFGAGAKSDAAVADLPAERLRVSPVYKEGEPVVILGPSPAMAAHAAGTATTPAPAAVTPAAPAPAPGTPAASTPATAVPAAPAQK